MASSCCQKMCLPALLRSPVFWCDQNFTPKCYRLTSLPNCMLSLYEGKENDTLLKAYHYYRKKKINLTVRVWNTLKKWTHTNIFLCTESRFACQLHRDCPRLIKILFNQHSRMSIHSISWQRARFFFPAPEASCCIGSSPLQCIS